MREIAHVQLRTQSGSQARSIKSRIGDRGELHLPRTFTRFTVVDLVGFALGALTSFLQTYLISPSSSLANSATPWLLAAFFIGVRSHSFGRVAIDGLLVTLFELLGFTVTSSLRGYNSGPALTLFWGLCAVVSGPIFGLAGKQWNSGSKSLQ